MWTPRSRTALSRCRDKEGQRDSGTAISKAILGPLPEDQDAGGPHRNHSMGRLCPLRPQSLSLPPFVSEVLCTCCHTSQLEVGKAAGPHR